MFSLQEGPDSQNRSGTAEHVFLPEMSTAERSASLGALGLKFHFYDTGHYNRKVGSALASGKVAIRT